MVIFTHFPGHSGTMRLCYQCRTATIHLLASYNWFQLYSLTTIHHLHNVALPEADSWINLVTFKLNDFTQEVQCRLSPVICGCLKLPSQLVALQLTDINHALGFLSTSQKYLFITTSTEIDLENDRFHLISIY